MRSAGVVCGLPVAQRAWQLLAAAAGVEAPECFPLVAEGAVVEPGRPVLEVTGGARVVLAGERTALDFVMVLSGIATRAAQWQAAAGPSLAVVDTRKTVPGLRALSKYAVAVGGASNHRMGLFDMVLIKDNHIAAAAASPARSRRAARAPVAASRGRGGQRGSGGSRRPPRAPTWCCSTTWTILRWPLRSRRSVRRHRAGGRASPRRRAASRSSGSSLAATGVDRVSASALTFAPPLDVGLDEG